MTEADAAHVWVGAFVAELARAGLRDVCACPGSRSTPLALGFAREPAIRLWMHLDERSAGYFALGLARGGQRPAAVVCTSGTAAANLAPAVAEAFEAGVPLLALTADRPPELRGWGAAQTIDQVGLFGRNVKWFADPGVPREGPEALRLGRALARRALDLAWRDPAGPVHVNLPFREPLLPGTPDLLRGTVDRLPVALECLPGDGPGSAATRRPSLGAGGSAGGPPAGGADPSAGAARGDPAPCGGREPTPVGGGAQPVHGAPAASELDRLAAELAGCERGLIVCGPHDDPDLGPAVRALGDALSFPILADPLSQVRCGPHHGPGVLDSYDACLRVPQVGERLQPQVVLRFGGPPTSKALAGYLARHAGARHFVVEPLGWRDPEHLATALLAADPREVAAALGARCGPGRRASEWLHAWQAMDGRARHAANEALGAGDGPTEAGLFPELARLLPPGAVLVAGNSMPVRDMDSFLPGGPRPLRVVANRGVNGIDGVLSTALGCAAAGGAPTVLVLGDLSFYHDMNGLLMARRHRPPLVVVLVHNDGGGIFSFLPQAGIGAAFETLFGTPHGLDFRAAARLYGLEHTLADTWPAFRAAVVQGLAAGGTRIVEVPSDRVRNAAHHEALWDAVRAAVVRGDGVDPVDSPAGPSGKGR